MSAVDLQDVNATCYAQHPALESVYGKSQPVIGGKLFSFYCIGMFELAQDLQDWTIPEKIQAGGRGVVAGMMRI